MDVIIDSWTTDIHMNLIIYLRLEYFFGPGEGVINLNSHTASPLSQMSLLLYMIPQPGPKFTRKKQIPQLKASTSS